MNETIVPGGKCLRHEIDIRILVKRVNGKLCVTRNPFWWNFKNRIKRVLKRKIG